MSTQMAPEHQDDAGGSRPAAEWITLAVSALIVIAMLSTVTWLYYRGVEEPARIVADPSLTDVRERDGSWYVPLMIENTGDRTVASVIVSGELTAADGETFSAEVTIDYLAGGERERATMVFGADPAAGELSIAPTSFLDP